MIILNENRCIDCGKFVKNGQNYCETCLISFIMDALPEGVQ
jgi:hypothetical protein